MMSFVSSDCVSPLIGKFKINRVGSLMSLRISSQLIERDPMCLYCRSWRALPETSLREVAIADVVLQNRDSFKDR